MDMDPMDLDCNCEYTSRVGHRCSSAMIEQNIGFGERRSIRRSVGIGGDSPGMPRHSNTRDELSEPGETLEYLTSEFGKPYQIPVDEDCCPDKWPDMKTFRNPYLKTLYQAHREAMRPAPCRLVTLNFRVMRRHAEMYIGFLLNQKGVHRCDLYKAKYLPIWTHCVRIKMQFSVKIGVIFHGLKSRLGVGTVLGLRFCLDGFYGVKAFGDAFGSFGAGVCPWMELSGSRSPKSLRLKDGDNIYVSVATESTRRLVQQMKQCATRKLSFMANAMTFEAGLAGNRTEETASAPTADAAVLEA